jgi:hypothetical protein
MVIGVPNIGQGSNPRSTIQFLTSGPRQPATRRYLSIGQRKSLAEDIGRIAIG